MQNKIAVEEHFALDETLGHAVRYPGPGYWADLKAQLLDLHKDRLAKMDRAGIEIAVLSLNSTAVQAIPKAADAVALARKANDFLAEQIARNPARFAGLAALPMQDPAAAAAELDRCVRELGLKGALVNGFSQVGSTDSAAYYDQPEYFAFWAEVERLGIPFYLHPRDPLPSQRRAYEGHVWLIGSTWSFAHDTAVHALRLIGSGLFDKFPKLKIVLGHLGERIPYDLWRLDHRLKKVPAIAAKQRIEDYVRSNFFLTTSGHYCTPSLKYAIELMGVDRVLFAVDYPFEDNAQAATWFDNVPMSEQDRLKIGRLNAMNLFNLRPQRGH